MQAALSSTKQLCDLIHSKPFVALCLSGRKEFLSSLEKLGLSATVKNIPFNHADWSRALVAESKVPEEDIENKEGLHVISSPSKHITNSSLLEEHEVLDTLAFFLKQHKRELMLSEKNYYALIQHTARTGISLETAKKALVMNGIPEKQVFTVAFRTSIKPVFTPDVCGQKTILKKPVNSEPTDWIRIGYGENDLVLKIPLRR